MLAIVPIFIEITEERHIKENTSTNLATMAGPISVNIDNGLSPDAQRENSSKNGG